MRREVGWDEDGTYLRASCGGIEDYVNGWKGRGQSADGKHTHTEEVGEMIRGKKLYNTDQR